MRDQFGPYADRVINPGSRPVEGATEAEAQANLSVFIDAATERGLHLADEPERDPGSDTDGRFGWILHLEGGGQVSVLMPGVGLAQVRDDPSAQAYCVKVGNSFWWWNDAVGMVIPIH